LLNTISLAINSKGGSFSSDFVERRRGGGTRAALRCRFKGPALRSVACLPTHPVLLNSTRPRKWGYMCGGESERRPPLRECGAFMWQCGVVCMAAGGKEREWEGGGEREREKQPFRQNHSTSTTNTPIDRHYKQEVMTEVSVPKACVCVCLLLQYL
jgi:hypothetical protein